ncbi:MFS transporter [Arthrobacter psychrolactophilus]
MAVSDLMGLTLLSTGLLLITAGLTFMRINGPGTWWAWAAVVLGIAALLPFTRHELGHKDPLIDIRLLRQPSMWPIQLTAFLFGVSVLGAQAPLSTFARTDPAEVGYGLGATSGTVSILIGVYVLGLLFGALLYPVVTRWVTPRITLLGAAIFVGVGYLMFLPFHDTTAQVLLNMAIAGLGSGALVAALPSAAAAAAPLTQTGMATGLTNAIKTVGGAFASCVFGIALAGQALGSLTGDGHSTAAPLEGYILVLDHLRGHGALCWRGVVLCAQERLRSRSPGGLDGREMHNRTLSAFRGLRNPLKADKVRSCGKGAVMRRR